MARLTPRFSTNRAVCEYTEQHYLPAASAYRAWAADRGALGAQIVDWRLSLERKWAALRFGEVKIETHGGQHVFDMEGGHTQPITKQVRLPANWDAMRDTR